MDGFIVKDGVVSSWAFGRPSVADREALAEQAGDAIRLLETRIATSSAGPTKQQAESQLASWRRQAAKLAEPSPPGEVFVEAAQEDWPEAVVGQAPAWPRTKRNRLLAETDYAEMPGWRAGQEAADVAAVDARRAALRALPKTHPDPLGIVWP